MIQSTTALPTDLEDAVRAARAHLDTDRIGSLLFDMTAIASPTGEERSLAELISAHLAAAGVDAETQTVAGDQANAVGWIHGTGDGPRLILYAPLDTAFTGDPDEDRPFLASPPRADFALPPVRDGSTIAGLGAENPKAFAAAGVAALEAVAATGVTLNGDAGIILASGSMPVDRRPAIDRAPVGHGTGIRAFLDASPKPDFAILLKPGYAVAHEEVGSTWFRIVVRGALNYTGIRHKGPYRNPILAAASVVAGLEAWFAEYSARHTDGLVAPQGSVNAITAGSADRASFVPATCEIELDLRISPRASVDAVETELRSALERIGADLPDFEIELQRRAGLPGSATDPTSWIVGSLVRAWEEREGRPHATVARASGASDAAIIRGRGIEAARIGLPPPATPTPYPGFSMGYADVTSVVRLAEVLIYAIIDTTARSRSEVGLA